MNNKLMALFAITALLVAPFAVNSAIAQTESTAVVTVPAVCGMTVPATLPFGSVANNSAAEDVALQIDNVGNVPVTSVSVDGVNWHDANPTDRMDVSQTIHDGTAATGGTALSTISTAIPNLASIAVSGNAQTYWDLHVSASPSFQGGLTQEITLTASCA